MNNTFLSYNCILKDLELLLDNNVSIGINYFSDYNSSYMNLLSVYEELDEIIYECAKNIYENPSCDKNFVRRETRKIYKSDSDFDKVKAVYYIINWFGSQKCASNVKEFLKLEF